MTVYFHKYCVLARIWRYDTYHDTGVAIRYIVIHCNTVSKATYWDISYFRNRIYFVRKAVIIAVICITFIL